MSSPVREVDDKLAELLTLFEDMESFFHKCNIFFIYLVLGKKSEGKEEERGEKMDCDCFFFWHINQNRVVLSFSKLIC